MNLPKYHIHDTQMMRDLGMARNKLRATRDSLDRKKYISYETETVKCPDDGIKSAGYLYDMEGFYDAVYALAELPDDKFLAARVAVSRSLEENRKKSGRHLRFVKNDGSKKKRASKNDRDTDIPPEGKMNPTCGIDDPLQWPPTNTTIIQINKENTSEVVEPSAPHEEPKVPNEKEALPYKSVPLGFPASQNASGQPMRQILDEIDDLEPSFPDDEDYDALFEKDEAEAEARRKELENPTDLQAAIVQWFSVEMKSPDYYIPSFSKANLPEDKLRKFWAIRDQWKTFPAIKKTDGSLMIFIRNIDKFIETYWGAYQEQLEIDRKSREFQERLWAEDRLMDKYGVWYNSGEDFSDPDWIDYRNARGAISRNTWVADYSNPYYRWANGKSGFSFRNGKLYVCNREVVKDEFSKKAILSYIESLKKPRPAKEETVIDEKFMEELMTSLEEDE